MPVVTSRKFKASYLPLFIIFLSIMSFGRLWFLHSVFWDDNCWLMSVYTSNNLREFLNTGFTELRREPLGTFLYYFLRLHKTSDSAFLIWRSINIGIQAISSVFLYFFFKNLLKNAQIAFLIAICFIICLVDSTVPVFSTLPYRLGLMLTIISLFLIQKALAAKTTNWIFFSGAIICSGIAQYILVEGVVALELARLLVVGYVLFEKKVAHRILSKKAVRLWLPFCLLCVPLVIYKLMNKPYGIYEGTYTSSLRFLFDIDNHIQFIKHILFYWVFFLKRIAPGSWWSIGLGFCAFVFSYLILKYTMIITEVDTESYKILPKAGLVEKGKKILYSMKFEYLLGVFLLVPPILLYEFAGQVPIDGANSRHAVISKFGYAVILGTIFYGLFKVFCTSRLKTRILLIAISLIFSGGVFVNNLNLDIYFGGWSKQQAFWKAFTARFPTIPPDTAFLIDVEGVDELNNSDLDNHYDLEVVLNMLYAQSTNPANFRAYKVIAIEDWMKCQKPSCTPFVRDSHWGRDIIDLSRVIVVYYKNNDLFVNREIIEQYPNAPYRILLNKDFPTLPSSYRYPLRGKMKIFR